MEKNDSTQGLLGGFQAVFDNLSIDDHDDENVKLVEESNDDIDDEELERLTASAKTGSSKTSDKKDEDEIEKDLEDNKDSTKNNKKEDNIEEHDDDESSNESEYVGQLFDAMSEQLGWEFDEDEEKPKNVEDLISYFQDVIEENSTPQYANDQVKELDEFVRNGGDITKYFQTIANIDYDNVDLSEESTQKTVLKEFLLEKGYTDKQISKKIEKYEDAGILEDEATDAAEAMKDIKQDKYEKLLENQRKEKAAAEEMNLEFYNSVVHEIKGLNDVRGIKIPEKDKKVLMEYIFKADANGVTGYQKDYSKSVKNLIESAYFTMKGDTLVDTAKKIGNTSALNTLKQNLKSSGIGKGTRKVSTSSAEPFWGLASQLLRKPN